MILNFNQIEEAQIEGFKGGQGLLLTRNYVDDNCKIMRSVLAPGASTGLHEHVQNCEIILVLKGTLTFHYDDRTENCAEGEVHYCPKGHAHYMENLTDAPVEYFAVVAELR